MVLFIPLGLALARAGARWSGVVVVVTLSLAVESLQLVIPGRDASLGDLVFNSTGGSLGLLVGRTGLGLSTPGKSRGWVAVAWGAAAAGVILLTGILIEPSYPESVYFGQWTPELGHLDTYAGEVLEARVGSEPIPSRRLQDSGRIRELLRRGEPLAVRFVPSGHPEGLAPVFSIYDDEQVEVVLIGVQGGDLVYRYRTRAASLRLDQPDLRIPNAMMEVMPGDVSEVRTFRGRVGHCIWLNGVEECGVEPTPGMGWAFFFYPNRGPRRWTLLLSGLWLIALLAPVGFSAADPKAAAVGAALPLSALLLVPTVTLLGTVTPWEAVAALSGVLLGLALRSWMGDPSGS
jgi:hypothetical protein